MTAGFSGDKAVVSGAAEGRGCGGVGEGLFHRRCLSPRLSTRYALRYALQHSLPQETQVKYMYSCGVCVWFFISHTGRPMPTLLIGSCCPLRVIGQGFQCCPGALWLYWLTCIMWCFLRSTRFVPQRICVFLNYVFCSVYLKKWALSNTFY